MVESTADGPIRDLTPAERQALIPHEYAVGVAGYPGAGKTTAAELFADQLDATYVNSGNQVRVHATEALGDDAGSEEIGAWIDDRIDQYGTTLVSEWLVEELETAEPATYAVVDGVRSMPEDELTNCFDRFFIVMVHADRDVRYRRIDGRDKPREEANDESDYEARDEREESYGLSDLYENERYDFFVENHGSLDRLEASVADVVTQLP